MDGHRTPVNKAPELAPDIDAGPAAAPPSFPDRAVLGAEQTADQVLLMAMCLSAAGGQAGMTDTAVIAGEGYGGPESGPGGLPEKFREGISPGRTGP